MNKPKLYIMVGLSASGKSTIGKQLAKENDCVIISSDGIRGEICEDSLEDAKRIAKETCDWIKEYKDDYMANNPVVINKEIDNLMTKVMTDLISFSIKREVNKSE